MIKAKKYFGQNFLKDQVILEQIIQSIPKDEDFIIEIGVGLGDLTRKLLKNAYVKTFEIDQELVELAKKTFKQDIKDGKLELIIADANKLEIWSDTSYFLVANLPYYVATRLILKALEDKMCRGFLVMVQKEVADKFCAKDFESNFCALSVLCGIFGGCELLFDVRPEYFLPKPKVMSSVIRLQKKEDYSDFLKNSAFKLFLKDCFSFPRKQLLSSFAKNKDRLKDILSNLNIKHDTRAHQIGVESYLKIFNDIKDIYESRK